MHIFLNLSLGVNILGNKLSVIGICNNYFHGKNSCKSHLQEFNIEIVLSKAVARDSYLNLPLKFDFNQEHNSAFVRYRIVGIMNFSTQSRKKWTR